MFALIVGIRWRIALAILAALGISMCLYLNRFGVDVEPDSAVMITAGLLCAQGEGVSIPNSVGAPKPMMWFPPLVPWMVALCERAGLNLRNAFGIFNAVAWGLLLAWVGALARRVTRGNSTLGLLAAGVVLTSGAIAEVSGMLYSEPPFLLWLTGSLVALGCWWERPLFRWAVLAGLCVGGAMLTRYVGLTLVALGGLAMFVRPGQKWGRRLLAMALFGMLSAGPMFAWHLWQTRVKHGSGERTLAWHPITRELIDDGIATLSSFIVPHQYVDSLLATRMIFGGACLLVCIALIWIAKHGAGKFRDKLAAIPGLVKVSAIFMVIYVAFLVVSISIADPDTPLDRRILSILIPPGVILAAYLAAVTLWEHGSRWTQHFVTAGVCGLLLLQGIATWGMIANRKGVCWGVGATSPILETVCALPPDAVIYSNDPYAIYMAARRKTEALPFALPSTPPPRGAQENLRKQMREMQQTLLREGGWVVYWDALGFLDPVIDQNTLKTSVRVLETKTLADGILLHVAPKAPHP